MWPKSTQTESVQFDIDFEAILNLNITLSGLTFSNRLVMGIPGLVHYIGDIETILGALTIKDEFAFARPYIGLPEYWFGPSKWDPDTGLGYPIGEMLFVKKRAYAEISIGGLTVSNLAMFEDVNFPEPWTPAGTTYPAGSDPVNYDSGDQAFHFGNIIGIEGGTVSGIKVTAKTGICADWRIRPAYYWFMGRKHYVYKQLEVAYNVIKKKVWFETVVPCLPNASFFKEYVAIEGIAISDILSLDAYSIVRFLPFSAFTAIEFTVNLFGIGTLYLWMDLVPPKDLYIELGYNPIVILTLGPGLTVAWLDNNDLTLGAGDRIYIDSVLELQNVSLANFLDIRPTVGLSYMHNEVEIPISFPEPIGTLTIDAEWYHDPATGHLKFEDIDFGIVKTYGEHNEFGINAAFNEDGMYGANLWTTVSFSL